MAPRGEFNSPNAFRSSAQHPPIGAVRRYPKAKPALTWRVVAAHSSRLLMDHRSYTALSLALEHEGVDVIQRLRDELAFTKAWIPLQYRDLQPGQFLLFCDMNASDMERESALQYFVDTTLLFAWESLAPGVCAMPLEMFAVQPTADNPYIDNTGYRQSRKTKHIKEHIEKTYLVDLDDFMVRFEGYDATFNLRLKLPFLYEDGTPMMATLAPHELVDGFGPTVVRHHGDSLWERAADCYYFIKETRVPRVAWRFVWTDVMHDPDDDEEDLREAEQYI